MRPGRTRTAESGYGQVVGIFIAVALDHCTSSRMTEFGSSFAKSLSVSIFRVVGLLIADEGTAVAVIDIAARSGHYTLGIRKLCCCGCSLPRPSMIWSL